MIHVLQPRLQVGPYVAAASISSRPSFGLNLDQELMPQAIIIIYYSMRPAACRITLLELLDLPALVLPIFNVMEMQGFCGIVCTSDTSYTEIVPI